MLSNSPRESPVLAGREHELRTLRDCLAAACGGHGSLALIGGEAGIGKTALAETICWEAARCGALVRAGRCYDLSETPPYGPWIELFGHDMISDGARAPGAALVHGGAAGAASTQADIFRQVLASVAERTAHQPAVFLLDDLHWADPASLGLLRFFGRALATLPLLLLVTYRVDELTRDHPLYALMPLLVRESPAVRIDLARLSADAIRSLVTARHRLAEADTAQLVSYLHERGDGNAFFTVELLRTLEERGLLRDDAGVSRLGDLGGVAVPLLLRQVIDGRVQRLGADARRLLEAAAVIGHAVPVRLWMAVTQTPEAVLTQIERAEAAHLLIEDRDGEHVRFVHALVREALYEGTAISRRRACHRRVGEALAATANADPDAVAHHFRQAGDERAAEWLVRAGERAERAYAWMTAAERYAVAVALMQESGADAATQAWLLLRLGWLRRWGDPDGAIAFLERATAVATETDDATLAGSVAFVRGLLYCRRGDLGRGIPMLRAATDALDTLSAPHAARVRALDMVAADYIDTRQRWAAIAMWLGYGGYYDEARAIAEHDMIEDAQPIRQSDEPGQAGTYNHGLALGFVHAGQGRPDAAIAAFARASALNRAAGNLPGAVQANLHALESAFLPYRADRPAERRRLATESASLWVETIGVLERDDAPGFPHLLDHLVEGRWDEARALTLAVRAEGIPTRRHFLATRVLAEIARHQGDAALAWALIHEALPAGLHTTPGSIDFLPALAMQRLAAALALDVSDLPTARDWLAAHDQWLAWNGAVLGQADGQLDWARYHRAAGDAACARHHALRALECATAPRQPLALLAAHRLLGELDTDAGRFADATAHLDAALILADACASPYERALTLLAQAALRAATGNQSAAAALLDDARTICTPLGAHPTLTRLDALAAVCTNADPPPKRLDGLTGRELEVLRHIAAGMSNRAMAEILSVSVRTIERHIENIYRKIDARSKADATAYAFRRHLV